MTPNDLYSEVAPTHRSRTSTEKMFFPLGTKRPDTFLKVHRGPTARRGSASTAATHRARHAADKLGL